MRIQSAHSAADRGLDAYFTPLEATISLCHIEVPLPDYIWEPACGNGAISKILQNYDNKSVLSTDIADYGYEDAIWGPDWDFLKTNFYDTNIDGIITNPPFKLAVEFAEKAISLVPYVALLLRTNFLESTSQLSFFRRSPPSRIWISSRRLPMMHRYG